MTRADPSSSGAGGDGRGGFRDALSTSTIRESASGGGGESNYGIASRNELVRADERGVELARPRAIGLLDRGDVGESEHGERRVTGNVRSVAGADDDTNRTPREWFDALRRSSPAAVERPAARNEHHGRQSIIQSRSPPIATLESPSPTSVSPSASPAIPTGFESKRHVFHSIPSTLRPPTPAAGNAATSSPTTDGASAKRSAAAKASDSAPRFPAQSSSKANGIVQQFLVGGVAGSASVRTKRERDGGFATAAVSGTVKGQRTPSPSTANSPAIASPSAVSV